MKLRTLTILLSLAASTASYADCPNLDLAGTWENGWGVRFKIVQPNCDHLTVRDLSAKKDYRVDFDGKTALTVKGDRLENAPRIVKYSEMTGGWDKRTNTDLLKDLSVVGKLIPNPGKSGYPQSKDVAELTLTARIDLPKDRFGSQFYPITASMRIMVGAYNADGDEIYISMDSPKVIALGEGEPDVFVKGFMAGINAILSLQTFGSFSNDAAVYMSGLSAYNTVIDRDSRVLHRVSKP